VGFSALVPWWQFSFRHGSPETRNFTKRSYSEGFGGFNALVLWRFIFPLPQNRRASSELSEVAVGEAQWLLQAG
jgi:hypothetical protein